MKNVDMMKLMTAVHRALCEKKRLVEKICIPCFSKTTVLTFTT